MTELTALLAGDFNNPDTKKVMAHMEREKIPFRFTQVENFDAKTPACYIGQFQMYGTEMIMEKSKDYYELSRRN